MSYSYSRPTYNRPANRTPATNYRKPFGAASVKQKRWYVDAQIPKSLPLIGGASFKAGTGTMLTKRSLVNAVKRDLVETKQKITSGSTGSLTANTILTYNILGNIPIGTGSQSRIGQTISLSSYRCHMEISNFGVAIASTYSPIYFRVACVRSRAQVQGGVDNFGSGLGMSDLFETGALFPHIAPFDFNKVVLLSDKLIKLDPTNTLTTGTTSSRIFECSEFGGNMDYLTPTSNYGKTYNTYLIIIPYQIGSTSGSTVLGQTVFEMVTSFQDTK